MTVLRLLSKRAAEALPLRIDDLAVRAFGNDAEHLVRIRIRGEVEDDDIVFVFSLAQIREHVLVRVIRVDPLKALPAVIILIQCRLARIQLAQQCEIRWKASCAG